MFCRVPDTVILAIALRIEWDRTERNQDIIDAQDDVGPLVSDDEALAVIQTLDIFGTQA